MKESPLHRFHLNILAECRALRWRLWQCPPFLFLIMGLITIVTMMVSYFFASRAVEEPEVAALIVISVAVVLFVVGNAIIAGFNRIAEANRMKTEFISLVSHQLRSPLSIFKWTLDVMERDASGRIHIERFPHFAKTLRVTTEAMIRMVNSLLEVSRIEARTFLLKKEQFSLNHLTRGAIEAFDRYARASNIAIDFHPDPLLPELFGDRERIEMVVENFIDNAIRYTLGAGAISITTGQKDGCATWHIRDQGVGIPPKEQDDIFNKFFRAKNAKQKEMHGSGIGLYAARAIIRASGGEIGFRSEENKGSIFWFTLPIHRTM